MMVASKEHLSTHYEDLSARSFFPGLINYMASGPVVCMVWEGRDAVAGGRRLLGATKPSDSAPGTIRADFAIVRAAARPRGGGAACGRARVQRSAGR